MWVVLLFAARKGCETLTAVPAIFTHKTMDEVVLSTWTLRYRVVASAKVN